MSAPQPVAVVAARLLRRRPAGPAARDPAARGSRTLTKAQAEDLLDWLESRGYRARVRASARGFRVHVEAAAP
jgi:hypothetical protein